MTLKALSLLLLSASIASPALGGSIIVQSTTSTKNSGLYDHLLPLFEARTGIEVRVVAVGTGQAIRNARNCDADVLLVHAKSSEEAFVEEGFGLARHDLMYNDFVIVGPEADPAGIEGGDASMLATIAKARARFASRGDESGTHKKERALWAAVDVDPTGASGKWYLETGSGMGAVQPIWCYCGEPRGVPFGQCQWRGGVCGLAAFNGGAGCNRCASGRWAATLLSECGSV